MKFKSFSFETKKCDLDHFFDFSQNISLKQFIQLDGCRSALGARSGKFGPYFFIIISDKNPD